MRHVSARPATLLGCILALLLACARVAAAHEVAFQGLVLGTDAVRGTLVIRYDAVAGMKPGTLRFPVRPAGAVRRIPVGATISATLDADVEPPALENVRVVATERVTGSESAFAPAPLLRNVGRVQLGDPVPEAPFVDQRGRPFSFRALRGSQAVLAFVYTRCRDARECPLVSAKFQTLEAKLRGTRTRLVEVTLDPAFDRPAVLARYGAAFEADPARWSLVTGDPERVLDFAARFQVTAFPDDRIGLIHPEMTALVDGDGIVRHLISDSAWAPDEIVAQLRDDAHLASNPLARLNLWLSDGAVAICGNAVAGFSGFGDLLVVLVIFGAFGYLLYRIARSIRRSPT